MQDEMQKKKPENAEKEAEKALFRGGFGPAPAQNAPISSFTRRTYRSGWLRESSPWYNPGNSRASQPGMQARRRSTDRRMLRVSRAPASTSIRAVTPASVSSGAYPALAFRNAIISPLEMAQVSR